MKFIEKYRLEIALTALYLTIIFAVLFVFI